MLYSLELCFFPFLHCFCNVVKKCSQALGVLGKQVNTGTDASAATISVRPQKTFPAQIIITKLAVAKASLSIIYSISNEKYVQTNITSSRTQVHNNQRSVTYKQPKKQTFLETLLFRTTHKTQLKCLTHIKVCRKKSQA